MILELCCVFIGEFKHTILDLLSADRAKIGTGVERKRGKGGLVIPQIGLDEMVVTRAMSIRW